MEHLSITAAISAAAAVSGTMSQDGDAA